MQKIRPDYLLFAGDLYADGKIIASRLNIPFNAVAGNCDGAGGNPWEETVEIMDKKFYLLHGHQYGVKNGMNRLYYRAQEIKADVVIYGHTHQPHLQCVDDIWFINPGSPTRPRMGTRGTYAVIELNPGIFVPRLIEL